MKLERFQEKNRKKKSIVIFTICCVFLIVGVFFYQSFALFETRENFNFVEGQILDPGDLYFAYYVDGTLTYEMPKIESGYTLSSESNCTNGVTIDWDIYHWHALLNYTNYQKENNSRVKCNLYFKKAAFAESLTSCGRGGVDATTCINHYKSLNSTNLISDETTDNNLRYVGSGPNNYIDIGDRDASGNVIPWRIIGVMNNIDDGTGKKETRLKVIRSEGIGEFSWDSSPSNINSGLGVNEWSQADLMKLMNPGYETESIGGSLYWNKQSGTCYNGQNNATASCDFTSSGLSASAKEALGEALWNTGSNGTESTYNNILISKFYELERSTNNGKICTSGTHCTDTVTRTTEWAGYVGLMYPSDYGYATSGGTTTNRETCLNTNLYAWSDASVSFCRENDWLYEENFEGTLMPYAFSSDARNVFIVYPAGLVNGEVVNASLLVRPVVYLKPNVKIISGEGTPGSPFVLAL